MKVPKSRNMEYYLKYIKPLSEYTTSINTTVNLPFIVLRSSNFIRFLDNHKDKIDNIKRLLEKINKLGIREFELNTDDCMRCSFKTNIFSKYDEYDGKHREYICASYTDGIVEDSYECEGPDDKPEISYDSEKHNYILTVYKPLNTKLEKNCILEVRSLTFDADLLPESADAEEIYNKIKEPAIKKRNEYQIKLDRDYTAQRIYNEEIDVLNTMGGLLSKVDELCDLLEKSTYRSDENMKLNKEYLGQVKELINNVYNLNEEACTDIIIKRLTDCKLEDYIDEYVGTYESKEEYEADRAKNREIARKLFNKKTPIQGGQEIMM